MGLVHSIRNPFPLGNAELKKAVSETKTVSALKLLCRPTLEAFGRKSDNRRRLRWCDRSHGKKVCPLYPRKHPSLFSFGDLANSVGDLVLTYKAACQFHKYQTAEPRIGHRQGPTELAAMAESSSKDL